MKKVAKIDILLPIIMLIVLLFTKLSENTVVILALTLFIGWALPYLINIITGIIILKDTHYKVGKTANLLSAILSVILIILTIRVIDKKLIVFLIEFSILLLLNIINYIYFKNYIKLHPDKSAIEKRNIKEKKKKNNGAIV